MAARALVGELAGPLALHSLWFVILPMEHLTQFDDVVKLFHYLAFGVFDLTAGDCHHSIQSYSFFKSFFAHNLCLLIFTLQRYK